MNIILEMKLDEEELMECLIQGDEEMREHWEEDAEDFIDTYFDDIMACCRVNIDTKNVIKSY